jgi:hypothetical protein
MEEADHELAEKYMTDGSTFHLYLMRKLPFAGQSNYWSDGRLEWDLVAFFNNYFDHEVYHFDSNLQTVQVTDLAGLFQFYNQEFFTFANLSPSVIDLCGPHIDDNQHCVCTHHIECVFICRNRITGTLVRIGSDCIRQFATPELIEVMVKSSDLRKCTGCKKVFHGKERKRMVPKMNMKVEDVNSDEKVCYCCTIPEDKRKVHRCERCWLLIDKGQPRCTRCVF